MHNEHLGIGIIGDPAYFSAIPCLIKELQTLQYPPSAYVCSRSAVKDLEKGLRAHAPPSPKTKHSCPDDSQPKQNENALLRRFWKRIRGWFACVQEQPTISLQQCLLALNRLNADKVLCFELTADRSYIKKGNPRLLTFGIACKDPKQITLQFQKHLLELFDFLYFGHSS